MTDKDKMLDRLIPDSECKQGKCAMTTTGCIGQCWRETFDAPVFTQTASVVMPEQAAKESSSKELEAATQRIADLCENKLANDQANYFQVSKLVDERDVIKAEKEALEKKLAEKQALLAKLADWYGYHSIYGESKYAVIGGQEELTKLLAAARKEERDTVMKELSEQEHVALSAETVICYIIAVLEEAKERGGMFPQTSGEQQSDSDAGHKTMDLIRWYGERGFPRPEQVAKWIEIRSHRKLAKEQPMTKPNEAPSECLIGTNNLPSVIDIDGTDVSLGDVVRYAFSHSKLSVTEWNALPYYERDKLLLNQVDFLRRIKHE
ncbi:MAG: hypothetical protein WC236_13700 [Gallionellaceae bacterium]|jgi:hypothetical protein